MAGDAGTEARNVAGALTSMRVDELVSKLAIGIATGQMALDQACMQIAQFMGTAQIAFGKKPNSDKPDELSLIELGFTPNFYQFVDTILEVRVAVSSRYEETREYDTSATNLHQDEYAAQSSYESSQSGSASHGGWGFNVGWGWGGWGMGGYSYGGSSQSSSASSSSSSVKSKNLSLNTVDAKFASTYNYSVEAASTIKTKIVPVPPPEVFEEIVRAKLKQRRDEEQRQEWRDQVAALGMALGGTISSLQADKDGLKAGAGITADKAAEVKATLQALADDYNGKLTTDHWAVVGSVDLRRQADLALSGATDAVNKLVKLIAEPTSGGEDTKSSLTSAALARLTDLATALAKIVAAVKPSQP